MPDSIVRLTRIGVFYDGNFFFKVSNYYKYAHARKARISISGLHDFVRHQVSLEEGVNVRFCQIVDAHFFRGRFSAKSAEERQQLYHDRVFDDILMGEGVVTHYLPMRNGSEKGVDVSLALEAFELAVYKRFDVMVLITGDGDFVPLARKLNSLGTRVMVLGWDFSYMDHENQLQQTTTSQHLLDEVPYAVKMQSIIDDPSRKDEAVLKSLFVESSKENEERHLVAKPEGGTGVTATAPLPVTAAKPEANSTVSDKVYSGTIHNLAAGFGFIKTDAFPQNIFFHWTELKDTEFEKLAVGQELWFKEGSSSKGTLAVSVTVKQPEALDEA
jgi:uncharacterized LabA/DUF88 family protein/cold shock CspA family protein